MKDAHEKSVKLAKKFVRYCIFLMVVVMFLNILGFLSDTLMIGFIISYPVLVIATILIYDVSIRYEKERKQWKR